MKTKRYRIIYLIIAIAVAVFAVGYAFGWIADDRRDESFGFGGSSGSNYFAGGTGTSGDPYLITDKYHMYNLAWLQNTGKFGTTDKYYFRVENDVDMGDMWLPPIGNDDYPFTGEFNGGGHKINNLKVTTNKLMLTSCPVASNASYKFSDAVGMFGKTANLSEATDADKCKISNFILQNPTVQVASVNTAYSGTGTKAAGLAVGHVAGFVSSIGVLAQDAENKTTLDVQKAGYTTFNSILGELADGVSSSVTGGGHGAGDIGYGAPTDLKDLYEVRGGQDVIKRYALPFKYTSVDYVSPSVDKITLSIGGNDKTFETAYTQQATNRNIGYYVGSDIKLYNGEKHTDYSKFYYPNTSDQSYDLSAADSPYPAPDEDVINYLNEKGQYVMRISGTRPDYLNESGLLVVENGQVGNYKGRMILPRRCVWVAPVMPGTLRFVFMACDNNPMGIEITRLQRETPKDYSTRFINSSDIVHFNNLLLPHKAYYITHEVTQEDIDAGYEYAVSSGSNGYQPYVAYIDIGANGGAIDDGAIDPTKNVSAVDFIYDGVTISTETSGSGDTLINIGDFIIGGAKYNATKTSIGFKEYGTILKIVFVRLVGTDADKHTLNVSASNTSAIDPTRAEYVNVLAL